MNTSQLPLQIQLTVVMFQRLPLVTVKHDKVNHFLYFTGMHGVNRLTQFQSFILLKRFDIVETWVHKDIYNNEILSSGYS